LLPSNTDSFTTNVNSLAKFPKWQIFTTIRLAALAEALHSRYSVDLLPHCAKLMNPSR
jgi:hypothetical protein